MPVASVNKVLVTGASGFVGAYFSKCTNEFSIYKLGSNIRINEYSSSNVLLQNILKDKSTVLHLANLAHKKFTDDELNAVNNIGTLELAIAASRAGIKRFVYVSTVNVHSDFIHGMPITEMSPLGRFPSSSKLRAEEGLQKIGRETGMEVTIVRSVLVYGVDAPGNMGLITKMVSRFPFTPFGLVKNSRSLISIGNLCDFLALCLSHPKAADEVFLVSDDQVISTPKLMDAIAIALGNKLFHLPIPVSLLRFTGRLLGKSNQVEHLIGDLEVDVSKAKTLLDWVPIETMEQAMSELK